MGRGSIKRRRGANNVFISVDFLLFFSPFSPIHLYFSIFLNRLLSYHFFLSFPSLYPSFFSYSLHPVKLNSILCYFLHSFPYFIPLTFHFSPFSSVSFVLSYSSLFLSILLSPLPSPLSLFLFLLQSLSLPIALSSALLPSFSFYIFLPPSPFHFLPSSARNLPSFASPPPSFIHSFHPLLSSLFIHSSFLSYSSFVMDQLSLLSFTLFFSRSRFLSSSST